MTAPDHYKLDDGSERWEVDDKLHRDDGPALITPEGIRHWYQHGVPHRDRGPAVDTGNPETSRWFIHGRELTPGEVIETRREQADARRERRDQNFDQIIAEGVPKPVKTMKPLKFG